MAEQQQGQQPAQQKQTFLPLWDTGVDNYGRFYMPRKALKHMFGKGKPRRVMLYLGPDGQVLLRPIR